MFDNKASLTASLQFEPSAEAAAQALGLVDDFVTVGGFGNAMHAKLAIIVEELVMNIVEHGKPPTGSDIVVALAREDEGIAITISDGGSFFDPREAPETRTIPERGGGAGLALVRAWAVIRDYARVDGVNRLDLLVPHDV